MLSVIPGTAALNQLSDLTSFLKFISTNDGIDEAVKLLAEERKKIDDAKAELQQHITRNNEIIEQLKIQEKNSLDRKNAADSRVAEAAKESKEAAEAWKAVKAKESDLASRERGFEARQEEVKTNLAAATSAAEKKLEEAKAMYAEGLSLKEKYEAKLQELRQSVLA